MLYCCVVGCHSSTYQLAKWKDTHCEIHGVIHRNWTVCSCDPPFTLLPLPTMRRDPVGRSIFIQNIRRSDLNINCSKGVRICSLHFVDGRPTDLHPYPTLRMGYEVKTDAEQKNLTKNEEINSAAVEIHTDDMLKKSKIRLSRNWAGDGSRSRLNRKAATAAAVAAAAAATDLETSNSELDENTDVCCCVPNCSRNSRTDNGLMFYQFPNDKEVKRKWLKSIRRVGWQPGAGSRICSWHFPLGRDFGPTQFEWNMPKLVDNIHISESSNSLEPHSRMMFQKEEPMAEDVYADGPVEQNSLETNWSVNHAESMDCVSIKQEDVQMDGEPANLTSSGMLGSDMSSTTNGLSDPRLNDIGGRLIHYKLTEFVPSTNQTEDGVDDRGTRLENDKIKTNTAVQHSLKLCRSLYHFYERELFCDTIVCTRNKTMKMHSVILASSTASQKDRLIVESTSAGALYTLDLSSFDSDIAETVISYMYLGELVPREDWGDDKRLDLNLLMITLGFTDEERELSQTQSSSRCVWKENPTETIGSESTEEIPNDFTVEIAHKFKGEIPRSSAAVIPEQVIKFSTEPEIITDGLCVPRISCVDGAVQIEMDDDISCRTVAMTDNAGLTAHCKKMIETNIKNSSTTSQDAVSISSKPFAATLSKQNRAASCWPNHSLTTSQAAASMSSKAFAAATLSKRNRAISCWPGLATTSKTHASSATISKLKATLSKSTEPTPNISMPVSNRVSNKKSIQKSSIPTLSVSTSNTNDPSNGPLKDCKLIIMNNPKMPVINAKQMIDFKDEHGNDLYLIPFNSLSAFEKSLKPFQDVLCEYCGENMQEMVYEKHLKSCRRKGIRCKACDREFITFGYLRKHDQQYHGKKTTTQKKSSNRKFVCEFCGKDMATITRLKYHLETKHSKESNHVCNVCGKTFNRPETLRGHYTLHSNEHPYKCTKCTKSFKTRSNLDYHQVVHRQLLKHECEICSKRFNYKCNLKTHIRNHHQVS